MGVGHNRSMKVHKGKAFSEYWESLSPMNSPLKIPMDNLLLEFLIKMRGLLRLFVLRSVIWLGEIMNE